MVSSSSLPASANLHPHKVFVYGSLLSDDVVCALLDRVPSSSPTILHHFHRFGIKGRVYPAILPLHDKQVYGRVLFGISDSELDILDAFEDEGYQRTTLDVSLLDGSQKIQAYTYVWGNKSDPDLYGEWDFEEWKKVHMHDFVKMTVSFAEELEKPGSKPRVATFESFYRHNE